MPKPPQSPLKIWCNAHFPPEAEKLLRDGTSNHALLFAQTKLKTNLVGAGEDTDARSADVCFGQPNPDDVITSQTIQWVHLNSASYTRYDRDDLRGALHHRGATLTNSSAVYADPCAQQVLAFMMARARRLSDAQSAQQRDHSWVYADLRPVMTVLTGETAIIYGFGAIARRLVELLSPFRMNLIGVRRHPRGDEPIKTIGADEADKMIGQADHLIDVLPSDPESAHFFNAARLARAKPTAVFYNVGRGETVDQPALIDALKSKRIAAAYLDVTTPEPLPPGDPLWTAPSCYITPHIAGGHQDEQSHLVKHFLENLKRFERGEALVDQLM